MELDLPRLRNYLTCYFEAKLTSWFLQENACGSRYKIVMNMKVNHFVARALVKNYFSKKKFQHFLMLLK